MKKILILSFLYLSQVLARTDTLSDRASNPITNLSQLQFENDYTFRNYGTHSDSNQISIKPLIALNRTDSFPFEQLIRLKFLIPDQPHTPVTKRGTFLGDTQFFDLFIVETSWGRFGFGPMAIFPTASNRTAGQGKWQLGPAFGLSVLKYTGWQFGLLAQNPISLAGNSSRPKQNYLIFQPFLIYHFQKNAYLITNPIWNIDWLHKNTQIPFNFGIGYTIKELRLDTCLQFQWMAYQNATKFSGYVNKYTVQVSMNILLN